MCVYALEIFHLCLLLFFSLKDEIFNNEKKNIFILFLSDPAIHLFPLLSGFCVETPGVLSNYCW